MAQLDAIPGARAYAEEPISADWTPITSNGQEHRMGAGLAIVEVLRRPTLDFGRGLCTSSDRAVGFRRRPLRRAANPPPAGEAE
ncbi:MAG: hypothetical protein LBE08_06825 [Bifidobacteriaceae bacterium]|jgi:hypothetical protein|nr:hypothetical protein [Bifidobacteriaceae bacterium]